MSKIFIILLLTTFIIINNDFSIHTAASEDWRAWAVYDTGRAKDGFQPPRNETIQILMDGVIAKEERLWRFFLNKWNSQNPFFKEQMVRIANTVKRIPEGQHHRFTLVVSQWKKQELFWYSSRPDVAEINCRTGEMTTLKVGKAAIRVQNRVGEVLCQTNLEVIPALPDEVIQELYTIDYSNVLGPDYDPEIDPETGMRQKTPYDDVEELYLPEEGTAVSDAAFHLSKNLEQVRIPANIKAITYDDRDSDRYGLWVESKVGFSVDGNNTNYYSISGVLFSYPFYYVADPGMSKYAVIDGFNVDCGKRMLLHYPDEKRDEIYYVPYGVEKIAGNAFIRAKYVRRVVLPNTVVSIGVMAFGSESLREIVIPASVTEFEGDWEWEAIDVGVREDFVIVTPKGSAAEAYAVEHGIAYRNE